METFAYDKGEPVLSENRVTGAITFNQLNKEELDANLENGRLKRINYPQLNEEFVGKKMKVGDYRRECLVYKEDINIRYQKKLVDRIENFCNLFGIEKNRLVIYFPIEEPHPIVAYSRILESDILDEDERKNRAVLLVAPLERIREEKYPIDELVLKKLKKDDEEG